MSTFSDEIIERAKDYSKAGQFNELAILMRVALEQVAPELRPSLRARVRKIVVNHYAAPKAGLELEDLFDWNAMNEDWHALIERQIELPERLPGVVGGAVVSMDKFLEERRRS